MGGMLLLLIKRFLEYSDWGAEHYLELEDGEDMISCEKPIAKHFSGVMRVLCLLWPYM